MLLWESSNRCSDKEHRVGCIIYLFQIFDIKIFGMENLYIIVDGRWAECVWHNLKSFAHIYAWIGVSDISYKYKMFSISSSNNSQFYISFPFLLFAAIEQIEGWCTYLQF